MDLEQSIKLLPRGERALKTVQSAHRKLRRAQVPELEGEKLHHFLDSVQLKLQDVNKAIYTTWFSPEQ